MDNKDHPKTCNCADCGTSGMCGCCGCGKSGGSLFWGVLFVAVGGFFLLQELGYIATTLSIWTIVLIVAGLWLLFKHFRK